MSSQAATDRVDSLLQTANEHTQSARFAEASNALREASHIEPGNAKVKEAWSLLQARSGHGDTLDCLKRYLESRKEDDGQKAIQALKSSQLDPAQSEEAVTLFIDNSPDTPLTEALTTALISQHVEVRKLLASRLTANATDANKVALEKGDSPYNAFAALPLDDALWPSKDVQKTAQQDLFRLNISTLIEPDAQHPERAMRAIARQVALVPDNIVDLVDADILEVILNSLDLRLAQGLRSQAMLVSSKLLEATGEKGESLFTEYVLGKVSKAKNDDLIVAFSAAAAIFPVIPAVVSQLFMTDGFVQQLVPNLERNSEAAASGKRKSNTLEQAALELLSAACMSKPCREAINRYCTSWLKALADDREGTNKALAALVLAKVIGNSSDNDVTAQLSALVLQDPQASEQAIEGLAYTSLQPKVKEDIVSNAKLLKTLVTALKENPKVSFGCLTAFANITAYRPAQSAEQKKMSQLKAYANSSKPAPLDPLDNDGVVTRRCKALLDADIIPALVASTKTTPSPTTLGLIAQILLSLSHTQTHRAKMAQQGSLKLLLQIYARSNAAPSSPEPETAHTTSHALARLLISLNPAHIFTPTLPATTAITILLPLLSPPSQNLLPTFEALLALTNLASLPDPAATTLLLRAAWPPIETSLLLSSTPLIQRASVEFTCNLLASPQGIALFADPADARAKQRLHILCALTDVDDAPTRRAAGGALAMLTAYEPGIEAVLAQGKGVEAVLRLVGDGDEGCKHRGLVVLGNLLEGGEEVGERVKREGGVGVVRGALRGVGSGEVMGVGVEVLKRLG